MAGTGAKSLEGAVWSDAFKRNPPYNSWQKCYALLERLLASTKMPRSLRWSSDLMSLLFAKWTAPVHLANCSRPIDTARYEWTLIFGAFFNPFFGGVSWKMERPSPSLMVLGFWLMTQEMFRVLGELVKGSFIIEEWECSSVRKSRGQSVRWFLVPEIEKNVSKIHLTSAEGGKKRIYQPLFVFVEFRRFVY